MMSNNPLIYCAIDKPDLDGALKLCEQIASEGLGIKIGLEFFNALGTAGVQEIQKHYPDILIFMDMKYYDIPNTVAGAIRANTNLIKPAYINVHASGGRKMMQAAKEVCHQNTKLLAVTILTSFSEEDIIESGYQGPLRQRVVDMAKLAQDSGMDGVVCSSHEIEDIRKTCGDDFILVVPGIRPAGSDKGDQSRIMTPKEAMDKGATHLVIGRPISQAYNPAEAAQEIMKSLHD
jgi:orotidine-5'-phosphate decarboxylase